jgi:hypothetical protein
VRRANAYVEAGIIETCYNIEKDGDENEKIKVVYILGMMCFNNEVISIYILCLYPIFIKFTTNILIYMMRIATPCGHISPERD